MTKYHKITDKELLALAECMESCRAMGGDMSYEAETAKKAVDAICKRNNIKIEADYSQQKISI